MVIFLERGADLHMAQLMPLPLTVSCFSKIQIGFTFLVLAHLDSPRKRPLNGCVCVCVYSSSWKNGYLFKSFGEVRPPCTQSNSDDINICTTPEQQLPLPSTGKSHFKHFTSLRYSSRLPCVLPIFVSCILIHTNTQLFLLSMGLTLYVHIQHKTGHFGDILPSQFLSW